MIPLELRVNTLDACQVMASIGENIKRVRESRGFKTQGGFARALDVPQPRLSDWENNRYAAPDLASLLKIATTLKVSVDELLPGFDDDYDKSRDLIRHTSTGQTGSPKQGESDGPTSARRVAELERQVTEYETALREVQDVAGRLIRLAERGEKGPATPRTTAQRRRRHRKTG